MRKSHQDTKANKAPGRHIWTRGIEPEFAAGQNFKTVDRVSCTTTEVLGRVKGETRWIHRDTFDARLC
jgi:hypothetical protein